MVKPDFLIPPDQEGNLDGTRLVLVELHGPMHPEHRHGIGHPFEPLESQSLQMKRSFDQPCSHMADDHGIGRCQSFKPGRNMDLQEGTCDKRQEANPASLR